MHFFGLIFILGLAPAIEIGSIWPPLGIDVFNPWGIPLLNTFILLLSGLTITYAHHALIHGVLFLCKRWFNYDSIFSNIVYAVSKVMSIFSRHLIFLMVSMVLLFLWQQDFMDFMLSLGTTFIIVCLFRIHHFTRGASCWI